MKVRSRFVGVRALLSAALVVAALATVSLVTPSQADAITRKRIIERGNTWVKKKVNYSQSRTYKGYRRDCSGFVSMAWKLKRSYTTRTISSRAKRIKISSLKPGDAVLVPGHVSLFAGWKNKSKRTYYALEQTTWGSHAKKRVRTIPRNAKALRHKQITKPKKPKKAKALIVPAIPPVPHVPAAPAPSLLPTAPVSEISTTSPKLSLPHSQTVTVPQ